jgi:membrane-bound metal-dependent hydrolase YbcI (DUF457 family)
MIFAPTLAPDIWLRGALDPILVILSCWMGWKASQYGKVLVAVIAAVALSVLVSWLMTRISIPTIAPVGRDYPTLLPVRTVSAFIYASLAFLLCRLIHYVKSRG